MSSNRPVIGLFHDGLSIPPKEGVSVHAYELARALALHADMKVVVVIADRGRATKEQLAKEPFDSILIHPDHYYDRTFITNIIREHGMDLVQNYNSYYIASLLGPAAQACKVPLLAEHHDLESDLAFLRGSSAEIAYQEHIQRLAIQYSARSRFLSSHDFTKIRQNLPEALSDKTFLMPVAFLPKHTTAPHNQRDKKTIVFVGNMAYLPNQRAAQRIIDTIAPQLPDAKFLIVGRGSKNLPLPVTTSNVHLLGEVDDLSSVLETATIGLAPISEGSGQKIKVISYLEAGLPVICSSVALCGYLENDSLIRADSADEAVIRIRELLNNDALLAHASKNAIEIFTSNYNILTTLPQLVAIYKQSIAAYRHTPIETTIDTPDMSQFPWHKQLEGATYQPSKQLLVIEGIR